MTRSKLSDREKQEIVLLFEQQQETIISLAERYQVSSSTIRRLLKSPTLSADPGISSVSQSLTVDSAVETPIESIPSKRVRRRSLATGATEPQSSEPPSTVAVSSPLANPTLPEESPAESGHRRPIRRNTAPLPSKKSLNHLAASETTANVADPFSFGESAPASEEISAILEDIGQALAPSLADGVVEAEDDEDFDDLDEEGEDLDDLDELSLTAQALQLRPEGIIEVIPLAQAILPKTCYLVVDRTAELVTRPLKDFGELGQVPEHEVQSCTLPVFDNHRIARRFSHRTQRIIKIPNSNMLKTTCAQLSAKGITRLLVNGHIYAL